MFTTLVVIVHLIVCVIMVLIILLQSGKGADIGAVFGGGSSQTVFGSSGATPFLSKITIGAAVTFMVTSIVLSYFSGQPGPVAKSVMSEQPVKAGPCSPGSTGLNRDPGRGEAGRGTCRATGRRNSGSQGNSSRGTCCTGDAGSSRGPGSFTIRVGGFPALRTGPRHAVASISL